MQQQHQQQAAASPEAAPRRATCTLCTISHTEWLQCAPCDATPLACVALAYFVLYMLHEFQKLHDRVHNDSAPGSPLLRGPLAAAEALFAAWTALALRGTLGHLRSKGAAVRLLMFRIFAGALAFIGAACMVYIAFEAYVHATHPVYDKWQLEWVRAPSRQCRSVDPAVLPWLHSYRTSARSISVF